MGMMAYQRVLFLFPPTGAWCREDRCQSYFDLELVPSMRAPMEECESAGAVREAGATPFLIDADPGGQLLSDPRDLVAEFGHLLRLGDISREQNDPAQAEFPSQTLQLDGELCAVETGD